MITKLKSYANKKFARAVSLLGVLMIALPLAYAQGGVVNSTRNPLQVRPAALE
jgi:hypothetical protein